MYNIGLYRLYFNYISLNIELIFVFDGKPPENKSQCIAKRKEKAQQAKELSEQIDDEVKKASLQKSSMRLTKEMIYDIKK